MKQIKLELIWRRNGVIEEEGSGRSQIFRRLGALAHIWRQRGRWQWIWGNRRCVGCHPIPEPPCSHHTHTHTHTVTFNTIIHTPTYTTCNPRKGKEKKTEKLDFDTSQDGPHLFALSFHRSGKCPRCHFPPTSCKIVFWLKLLEHLLHWALGFLDPLSISWWPWASYLPFCSYLLPVWNGHDNTTCFRGLLRGFDDLMDVDAWNCGWHKIILFGGISILQQLDKGGAF